MKEANSSIPAIDIRPDHWEIVRHTLRLRVPQYAVWAFGSRAKWTAKPHSDLDLAIITDEPLPLSVSAALEDDFLESNLPWKVDVVDWAAISESFRKIIERNKVVVQEPAPPSDAAVSWPIVRIEDIAEKIAMGPFGSNIKVETFVDSGIPVISGNHLRGVKLEDANYNFITEEHADRLKNSNVFRGDVIFTHAGNIGQVAYIPSNSQYERYVISQRQFYLRCNLSKADPVFISYFFHSDEGQYKLLANASQTGVPSIARPSSYLKTIELRLPAIEDQRAIAKTLGTFDDRIDNLRQINITLQAIAAALFKSWFVDFDGVPPQDMQESELRTIPKGWRVGTLAELCELNASKWTDNKHPPTLRYIDLSGVSSNRIEGVNELAFDDAPSRARLHLREGDTIVGTVRPGNRAFAYIHAPPANLTGSTGFAVLSPKHPHYASFIYLAATRDEAIERLANLADGAAYPAVRPKVVSETPCVIAPDEVIAEFSAVTKPLLERIEQNNQQAVTLAALRDTLLPRLISGRLRVAA